MARRTEQTSRQVDGAAPGQSIAAVERALDVLLHFARSSELSLGVTEISTELAMPKAAVHRILSSLRSRDLIAFDPRSRRYLLGAASVVLGRAYLSKIDVRSLAATELTWLSAQTNETATLSIRHGDTRVYVDQVLPRREVRMEVAIGGSYPLHAGASSKAFLAFMEASERQDYLERNGLDALTPNTITARAGLDRDLTTIRERGYASSIGERQAGAASVAAPLFDYEGGVAAVISVSGPASRIADAIPECAEALLVATGRVSARLGYSAA